jgi:peptidoglycan LD-endopeptidase LytH
MRLLSFLFLLSIATAGHAQVFRLPTPNRAIYEVGGSSKYYVGTTGKPWTSGTFGCVRTGGTQFHEGIDIRCLQRDKQGEPIDPVFAVANGTVAYISDKPGLSNYGNYIVLRHQIAGLEIYSLYAHLRSIRPGLRVGQPLKAGESIAVLGRTANTREGISKDRAHLHFELNFLINDRFTQWHAREYKGQRNDHGDWNGQNLVGIDPSEVLIKQNRPSEDFNLVKHVREQTELFRVVVRDTSFPWLARYAPLVWRNPTAAKQGVAAYEITFSHTGVPFKVVPRAESELKSKARVTLLSVNEAEQRAHSCRKYVTKTVGRWELAPNGERLIDLLTF